MFATLLIKSLVLLTLYHTILVYTDNGNGKSYMNKSELLEIITNPVDKDYLTKTFLKEWEKLKNPELNDKESVPNSIFEQLDKNVVSEWHDWVKCYIKMYTEGKLPSLWPMRQYGMGFEFKENLDDFDANTEYFSLGTDPIGDWFVMTKDEGGKISLSDHHTYGLYDHWLNPNHLIAWALRLELAVENNLTEAEIMQYWKGRANRLEKVTVERIANSIDE